MNIVIPMTGYGSRFVAAGYKELKPFIKVMDRPVIEWIVKGMYPADVNFIFVCRGEHLKADPSMREQLFRLAPGAVIVSIDDWVKKGPVYDVLRAYRMLCRGQNADGGSVENADVAVTGPAGIDAEAGFIINYCDLWVG